MPVLEKNRLTPDAAASLTMDGPLNSGTDSGTANVYEVTVAPAVTVLRGGLTVSFFAVNANTGAATLDVCTLSAKPLVFADGSDLIKGAVPAGHCCLAMYDGACWLLLNPAKTGAAAGAREMFLKTQY